MADNKPYTDFSDFLSRYFEGKVQKISINAGFSCPNRDGSKGTGGCTYCNNQTFNPDYCKPQKSITTQLIEGKQFFARKYPSMKYLAYFQAYTNTYADVDKVIAMYEEALAVDDVVGIIVGTRPDCMPDTLLQYLANLSKSRFVLVEYGVETSHDSTLQLINRCHTWQESVDAINRTVTAGVLCGVHVIMGLPGESVEMMLSTIDNLSKLPISTIKIHQLQLIRGTKMARDVEEGRYKVAQWNAEQYVDLCCEIVKRIPRRIAIERFVSQSPDELLISPRWGLKNYQFTNLLLARLT
ncbi:MAG: TIGR01212 family radical SAM protein [Muribaculaceae bacterium]|nr:TIGR01212 family radical SAM protein [Muribaculaceae bacterium]